MQMTKKNCFFTLFLWTAWWHKLPNGAPDSTERVCQYSFFLQRNSHFSIAAWWHCEWYHFNLQRIFCYILPSNTRNLENFLEHTFLHSFLGEVQRFSHFCYCFIFQTFWCSLWNNVSTASTLLYEHHLIHLSSHILVYLSTKLTYFCMGKSPLL